MSSSERRDPLPVYCFKVELRGVTGGYDDATAFFKSVGGLRYESEVVDYREGGENGFAHRLFGGTKWGNLVLKRGFTKSFSLVQWYEDWLQNFKRVSGNIVQLDTNLKPVCRWEFKEGWPCKWELAEFDASKSELSIETLEIAHHGLKFSR